MKLTMRLTLDGLVRSLRGEAHRLADEIDAGYARDGEPESGRRIATGRDQDDFGKTRDDRAGR